ncbi:MAG: hypothetical protein EZS28_053677 [Streblomastix strix]|uniref:PDEase domain-containing protein n=1 Tax=Streblomastix strix TaxID=222440 RepID=A0A5J4R828_9EUKA|nr:MAG: hypothetical protein EZS28_053677 [Streblomastix strix]
MGSQCRQFKIAKKATLAVSREFFQQGDLERMGKMAVSKFMDRTTANDKEIANSQIGFIDFLLGPLIDAVSPHINADLRVKTELNHNRSAWRRIALGCEPDDEEDISDVEGSNEVFNPIRDGDADKSKYQFLGERFDELMSADLGEILNAIDVAFGKQEGKSE